jgi:hypothetical protein
MRRSLHLLVGATRFVASLQAGASSKAPFGLDIVDLGHALSDVV